MSLTKNIKQLFSPTEQRSETIGFIDDTTSNLVDSDLEREQWTTLTDKLGANGSYLTSEIVTMLASTPIQQFDNQTNFVFTKGFKNRVPLLTPSLTSKRAFYQSCIADILKYGVAYATYDSNNRIQYLKYNSCTLKSDWSAPYTNYELEVSNVAQSGKKSNSFTLNQKQFCMFMHPIFSSSQYANKPMEFVNNYQSMLAEIDSLDESLAKNRGVGATVISTATKVRDGQASKILEKFREKIVKTGMIIFEGALLDSKPLTPASANDRSLFNESRKYSNNQIAKLFLIDAEAYSKANSEEKFMLLQAWQNVFLSEYENTLLEPTQSFRFNFLASNYVNVSDRETVVQSLFTSNSIDSKGVQRIYNLTDMNVNNDFISVQVQNKNNIENEK
ncbi:phage portal protein [Flammeovirga pectinis]|uniref:Phage portal protein n=1 Tax=Flammeovirga pectinis TaxID=2494373 RepID=A0A3Q9FPB2_9BACT|nr:phage portal protein [Flammeovirga pectinis]AZQ62827.1 phage portal protein [Flammeovirga pectinis]